MAMHGTTILAVRRGGITALGGDGQVTVGNSVMKAKAVKIRRLQGGNVLAGFAGSVADALTLFDRFEAKLREHPSLRRAAVELAKDWRSDRYLRHLQAMLIAADADSLLLVSGTGEVLEPDAVLPPALDGQAAVAAGTAAETALAVGSGGNFAVAAARALLRHSQLSAMEIVRESLGVAAELCIYTNGNLTVEQVGG
ncbi:ATP-dependent protease subunit HslV [bacterium]|nr:ATP-dependent protease subunit HslV [bacterium]